MLKLEVTIERTNQSQDLERKRLLEALESLFIKRPELLESYYTHCMVIRDISTGPIRERHLEGKSYIENLALKNFGENSS